MGKKDFRFGIDSNVQGVDLNQLLIAHSASTFYMRMAEDDLTYGVTRGDILIVDRSLTSRRHDLLVLEEEGSEQLKIAKKAELIDSQQPLKVWGVVTYVIKKVRA